MLPRRSNFGNLQQFDKYSTALADLKRQLLNSPISSEPIFYEAPASASKLELKTPTLSQLN